MAAQIVHLDKLLEKIQKKTSQPLDWAGFGEMSKQMMEESGIDVNQKYLYDNFHRKKEQARRNGKTTHNLKISKLDLLATFAGFSNYRQFIEWADTPVDTVLGSCVGNYYSYVRQNDDLGIILRSPVKIVLKNGKVWFELKGGKWTYTGEVLLTHGCLFILMRAAGGKMIHHVYKIGARERPIVLQGIFSGVSTAFDPIGGRAVLVRSEEHFNKMSNEKWEIEKLLKSGDHTLKNIGQYLAKREGNNLSINSVGMTFDFNDLGTRNIPGKTSRKSHR